MARIPTPKETPLPSDCDTTQGRPCPYHQEIEMVRQWRKGGLDEIMIVSRRRDKLFFALIAGLIVAIITLGSTAIWGGIKLASGFGELSGTTTTRLEDLESDRESLESLARSSSDGQTKVLVTLGEMREQLRGISTRLARVENAQSNNRGRRR